MQHSQTQSCCAVYTRPRSWSQKTRKSRQTATKAKSRRRHHPPTQLSKMKEETVRATTAKTMRGCGCPAASLLLRLCAPSADCCRCRCRCRPPPPKPRRASFLLMLIPGLPARRGNSAMLPLLRRRRRRRRRRRPAVSVPPPPLRRTPACSWCCCRRRARTCCCCCCCGSSCWCCCLSLSYWRRCGFCGCGCRLLYLGAAASRPPSACLGRRSAPRSPGQSARAPRRTVPIHRSVRPTIHGRTSFVLHRIERGAERRQQEQQNKQANTGNDKERALGDK